MLTRRLSGAAPRLDDIRPRDAIQTDQSQLTQASTSSLIRPNVFKHKKILPPCSIFIISPYVKLANILIFFQET